MLYDSCNDWVLIYWRFYHYTYSFHLCGHFGVANMEFHRVLNGAVQVLCPVASSD